MVGPLDVYSIVNLPQQCPKRDISYCPMSYDKSAPQSTILVVHYPDKGNLLNMRLWNWIHSKVKINHRVDLRGAKKLVNYL